MARTYSRYRRDQLSELCHDLITEPWDPEGLLAWLQSRKITRSELSESVLTVARANVVIDESFNELMYKPEMVEAGLRLYKEMLNHPKYREGAVNYLWAHVHENMSKWLGAFCLRMDASALCSLLVTDPSNAARKQSWKNFNLLAVPHIPEAMKEPVMVIAAQRRQISKLFSLTGWPGCRELAKGLQRDQIMTIDLGL